MRDPGVKNAPDPGSGSPTLVSRLGEIGKGAKLYKK